MVSQQSLPEPQPENLPGTAGVMLQQPKKSNRNLPILFIGIAIGALCLCSIIAGSWLFLIQRGVAEVTEMGPWPGAAVAPEELVKVDLSHLGLQARPIQNARDEETWENGQYENGVLVIYQSAAQDVVAIWALRYTSEQAAGNEFGSVRAWAEEGNCGFYTTAYFGNSGVVHCQFDDAYDKIFWNDRWIVDIVALDWTEFAPDILVDHVRDALSAYWKVIAQPGD